MSNSHIVENEAEFKPYYSRTDEIFWMLKNQQTHIGVTANGHGSTHIGAGKEPHINERLVKLTNANFYAKIVPEHSDKIITVTKQENAYYNCDALIAPLSEYGKKPLLISNTGDCPIITLISQDKSVFALVHSGWKGCYKNITSQVILELMKNHNIKISNLEAYIWPGISKNKYCVNEYFNDFFPNWVENDHFDMKEFLIDELLSRGISPDKIKSVDKCSYSSIIPAKYPFKTNNYQDDESLMFYSYRRAQDECKRNSQLELVKSSILKKRNCVFAGIV